jgi:hypothetical protein
MMPRNASPEDEAASTIALQLLGFLLSDDDRLAHFLALTGLGLDDLRAHATDRAFQGGLLDYALADESLLLAFAAERELRPESVLRARQRLPGASHDS